MRDLDFRYLSGKQEFPGIPKFCGQSLRRDFDWKQPDTYGAISVAWVYPDRSEIPSDISEDIPDSGCLRGAGN